MTSEATTAADPSTDAVAPAAQPAPTADSAAAEGSSGAAGDSAANTSVEAAETEGEAGEVDLDAILTVRALISTKEAGVVIGKGGQNVAELREKLGVKAGVTKVVPGVHDRVLSVSGSVEGIAKAYSLIGQNILENVATGTAPDGTPLPRPANAFTSVRLLIAHTLMGTVIGRSGLKIKHIQDVSGARMVASKDMLPNSSERVVEVQGTSEAIRIAVLEIAKCLMEDKDRNQGTMFYNPSASDGPGVLAAGGIGGLQGNSRRPSGGNYLAGMGNLNIGGRRPSGPNGEFGGGPRRTSNVGPTDGAPAGAAVTPGGNLTAGAAAGAGPGAVSVEGGSDLCIQNISIPSDMVGCIIGKGGSRITEIRRLSGSRISIAKVPHDDTGERMFTIQGSAEANEKALFLLYNQLETEKERRTSTVAEEDSNAAAAAEQGAAGGDAPSNATA